MPYHADKHGRSILVSGTHYSVVCAVKQNGKIPVLEFLDNLDDAILAKFIALFERRSNTLLFWNPEQFKKEQGDIWTFKYKQYRVACYQDGSAWVLLQGFVKKKQKWQQNWFVQAEAIKNEDLERKQRKK